METTRKLYPSDISDAEWEFLVPFLTLMREDAPQREHAMRDLFDATRYVVKTGCQWRYLPHDFPPWSAAYQQARRWFDAGVFEAITHELRVIVRMIETRAQPSGVIRRSDDAIDPRERPRGLRWPQEKEGLKIHAAVDSWEICSL